MTQTPQMVYDHWQHTHKCIACHSVIRHEMHLYNHWRKWHAERRAPERPAPAVQPSLFASQTTCKPRYWVWFQNTWVTVPMHTALAAMIHKRCVAVEKVRV